VVRNQFLVRVINKRNEPSTYRLELTGAAPPGLQVTGAEEALRLEAMGEEQKTLVLSLPEAGFSGPFKLQVKVTETASGASMMTRVMEFLGPDPRLKSDVPLNPRDFVQ
jgi:hypothetical protein